MATSAETTSTAAALGRHLQCFGAGDLTGIMEDYTDESFAIFPDGSVLRGPEQLRAFFTAIFAEFAKPGASFTLSRQVVEGEIGYITWSAETADNIYEIGVDTFVIRDGKFLAQTFGGKIIPKS